MLALAEQLKNIAESRIRALWLGGINFLGWDSAQYARANTYDLLASFALGIGGKRIQDKDRYPRPKADAPEAVTTTIEDFDIGHFMAQISGR